MPVEITYEGQKVTVDNNTDLELNDIREIPANSVFVCEPSGPEKKRYAFSIEELNKQISMGGLQNYYSREPFTLTDINKLSAMSPPLAEYFHTMANFPLNTISEQTLKEIHNFADNTGYFKNTEFAREVMERRKADIENLKGIATPSDIIRGEAFAKFKDYYMNLPAAEKAAIHNFPGVKEILQTIYSLNSIDDLFKLPQESCLGGTAAVCTLIRENINQAKYLQTAIAKQQNHPANPAKPKAASPEPTLSSEQQKIKDDYIKFVDEVKNTKGNRTQKRSAGFILKNLQSAFQACNTAANANDRDQAYRTLAIEVAAAKEIAKSTLGFIRDEQPAARTGDAPQNRKEEPKQQLHKLAPPPQLVVPPRPLFTKPASPATTAAAQRPARPAAKNTAAVLPPPMINIHHAVLSPNKSAPHVQRPLNVFEVMNAYNQLADVLENKIDIAHREGNLELKAKTENALNELNQVYQNANSSNFRELEKKINAIKDALDNEAKNYQLATPPKLGSIQESKIKPQQAPKAADAESAPPVPPPRQAASAPPPPPPRQAASAPPPPPPRQTSPAAKKADDSITYTPKHSTHDSDTSWMKSPLGANLNKLGQEVAFVIAKLTAAKGYTAIDLSAISLTDSPVREKMVNDLLSKFPNSQKEILSKCFDWQKQIDDMIAGIKTQKNPDPEIPAKMDNMMQEMRSTFSENISRKKSSLFVNKEHNTLMARAAAGVTNIQKSMHAAEKSKNVIENIVDKVFNRKP